MHKKLLEILPIDRIYVCYHLQKDNTNVSRVRHVLSLKFCFITKNPLYGNRFSDIEAGKKFKVKNYFDW